MRVMKGKVIHPIPKSWDYFFRKRESSFILVHLKDGNLIGGLFSGKSFASSYPEKEDLYIEQVWKVDADGTFKEPIEGTKGFLVNSDFVNYIEFLEVYNEKKVDNVKAK